VEIQSNKLAIRIAELVESLPPMPQNIDRILVAAHHDKIIRRAEIFQLIKEDPGLSADLLHIANDTCSTEQNFETIEDAFEYIGVRPLIQLIGYCYARNTVRVHFDTLKNLNQYFAHSKNISRSCRALAVVSNMSSHDREIYITAGLIHDLGRLVVMLAGNMHNAPLIGTTAEKMAFIDHDERKVLGLSHSEVGWRVCRKWKFSPILQEAVLRHHTPIINGDFSSAGGMIFVAHFVSYSDMSGEILSRMLPAEILTNLNLTIKDFIEARKLVMSGL
jgi:HD-like signal output (HDOD) protein